MGFRRLETLVFSRRNLVRADAGTRFVLISHNGWDLHANMYDKQAKVNHYTLCRELDSALSSLLSDLKRGSIGRRKASAGENLCRLCRRIRPHRWRTCRQQGPRSQSLRFNGAICWCWRVGWPGHRRDRSQRGASHKPWMGGKTLHLYRRCRLRPFTLRWVSIGTNGLPTPPLAGTSNIWNLPQAPSLLDSGKSLLCLADQCGGLRG